MDLQTATTECVRWLTYLDQQKERADKMTALAAERRRGDCTLEAAKDRIAKLDREVTVYDGHKLSEAVRFLVNHVARE